MAGYIPDQIERWEASAERWFDENVRGDEFLCSCEKWCKLSDGQPSSPNPYAPPICPDCLDEMLKSSNNRGTDDGSKQKDSPSSAQESSDLGCPPEENEGTHG